MRKIPYALFKSTLVPNANKRGKLIHLRLFIFSALSKTANIYVFPQFWMKLNYFKKIHPLMCESRFTPHCEDRFSHFKCENSPFHF